MTLTLCVCLPAHSTKRNPVTYVSLIDEPLIKTPSHRVHSHSSFDLTFTLHNGETPVRLALEPNHNLLHDEFSVTRMDNFGEVRSVEYLPRSAHRVYKGKAFVRRDGFKGWSHAGWARITMRRDGSKPVFEGAFRIDGDSHHIQTGSHYLKLKHEDDPSIDVPEDGEEVMVVYRDSDIRRSSFGNELKRGLSEPSCGSDTLDFNSRYDVEVKRSLQDRSFGSMGVKSLFGRQSIEGDQGDDTGANYIPDIGSVEGCPTSSKVALVGIATDCNYWEEFNENEEDLRQNIISIVNQASSLYEDTFSISLGIKNLTIIDQSCSGSNSDSAPWNLPCGPDVSLNDRLNLFSQWRGRSTDQNAYWTLLTTCNTDTAVGLAWRGQLCREGAAEARDTRGRNETIAATNVVVRTPAEWQIFAHETGHTFGAVHDCTERDCPVNSASQSCCPLSANSCDANSDFIMNPSTGEGISNFSPCSIGNICSGLARNINGQCLTDNRNVGTITGSQCGNGIVESGEDCDCGGADDCGENSCCNPETCEYRDGAVCDPTNEDCCTDQCEFMSSGTVCRESNGECDPEETCSGDGGSCPRDEHMDDGDSCGDGLSCASGQCTSRTQQCRVMIGDGNTNNGDIEACGGSDTCSLTCSSPGINDGVCTIHSQNFLDGTSCGGGGRCQSGSCEGSSTWGRIVQWFEDNKNIAIPVGSVLAALLVLAIASCIWSRCKRRRRVKRAAAVKPPEMSGGNSSSPTGGVWQAGNHPIPPLPPQRQNSQYQHTSSPPPVYNPEYGSYGEQNYNYYEEPPRWNRGGSTRYA